MSAERVTGDSIAAKIHTRTNTDSFADIARDLATDHQHRPGMFNQDLQKVNTEMHNRGILPGVDIVGVQGQDLITRNAQGQIERYDSTNLSRNRQDFGSVPELSLHDGDRTMHMNPDGSGTYKVEAGDNNWRIARDVMKAQGNENPSLNQVGNYVKELERANPGVDLNKIRPGDTLNIPANSHGGDTTSFNSQRAIDTANQQTADVQKTHDEATAALEHLASRGSVFGYDLGNANISREEIDKALKGNDLSAADRRGLTFIQQNFDQLKQTDGVFTPNDVVYARNIDKWQQQQQDQIGMQRDERERGRG